MRGVSDLARMTPGGGRGEVRRPAAPLPRARGASWARPPTTCPACPGVGPGLRRQVDQPVRRPRQRHRPRRRDHRQEGRGAARAPRRRDPQPPAQRAGPRPRPRRSRPADLAAPAVGPPGGAHALRRAGVPRCCATGCSRRSTRPRRTIDESGLRARPARGSAPARSPAGSTEHAAGGERVGVAVQGTLAGRHRRGAGRSRSPTGDGTRRLGRRRRGRRPRTTRRWPPGSPTPTRPKVLHDAKGPMLALAARGWDAARAGQRHRAGGLPRPARPALLRPGRPDPALPQARAAPGRRRRRPAQPSTRSTTPTRQRHRDAARPRRARPRRRARRRGRGARRHPPAAPRSSCRWSALLARMEQTGIAVDIDHLEAPGVRLRRPRCSTAADDAYAVIGKEINLGSPKQLQVVLFDELDMPKTKRTKTGYTTDADALQALYEKTEHPFLPAPAAPPRRHPAAPDRRGPAQDGRLRRPHPHHVQPDHRRHRPALQHRPQPAEHPDPHRGGPPDPRGLRRRRGLRVADDRRLQPDRDADHGPPVRGRPADRGVPAPATTSTRSPPPGSSTSTPTTVTRREARQDQGDELRPRLRPVRVRARASSCGIEPGEARGLMDEYFETFGGVRDYLGGIVDEARRVRLHRDHPGPPPLPARPHQRQPAAPRDGRADGAQRARSRARPPT